MGIHTLNKKVGMGSFVVTPDTLLNSNNLKVYIQEDISGTVCLKILEKVFL